MRHGESEANVKKVHAGQKDDTPLTEKGIEEAKQAAKKARDDNLHLDRILSSPLQRARLTAEIMAEEYGLDVEIVAGLTEYDMGLASGLPIEGTPNDYKVNNPEAEDVSEFQNRVLNIVNELRKSDQNILIVTHGGVGRIIRYSQMIKKPDVFYDIEVAPNCAIVPIEELMR